MCISIIWNKRLVRDVTKVYEDAFPKFTCSPTIVFQKIFNSFLQRPVRDERGFGAWASGNGIKIAVPGKMVEEGLSFVGESV